jgi:murein DD-endopeptidase MepM/ murein hydrolase activator NlpD
MTTHALHLVRRTALAAAAAFTLATAVPELASAYGWPVKPFDRQHPVRGFFGDPRIGDADHSTSFHFGVDVVAANGTPVYATLSGRASIHPLHHDTVEVSDGRGRVFSYWHVLPSVRTGDHVVAYRTLGGHVRAPWAHVHFSEAVAAGTSTRSDRVHCRRTPTGHAPSRAR